MATEVVFPKLGLDTAPGRIVAWHKELGDDLVNGEAIFDVETDKVTVSVESPADGVLLARLAEVGDEVAIGSTVAIVGARDEPFDASRGPVVESQGSEMEPVADPERQRSVAAKVRASPVARRRAVELGVDLADVRGSGPEGRVTSEDVEALAARASSAPDRSRAGIDAHVTAAWKAPHINIGGELVADGLAAAHGRLRASGASITVTDLLLKVVGDALAEVPELNATFETGSVIAPKEVHLGFAVATDRGVVIPVLHDIRGFELEMISRERARLAREARSGALSGSDLAGGTATLSNLGAFPVDFFTPVLYSPQVCLVATGRIRRVPVVEHDAVTVGSRMWVNACIDHRAADGEAGGRLLGAIERGIRDLGERFSPN